MTVDHLQLPIQDAPVSSVTAALHVPAREGAAPVLLTHGAGGGPDAEGLVALADVLVELGHPVVRVTLPYREAGRRAPRADRTVPHLQQLLETARTHTGLAGTWIAGGKSYGGRVASLAAADGTPLLGLLFYGYPLHPPGKPDRPRVEHWPHVQVPTLFLQGTRDPFCDLALLEQHLRKLPRRATVEIVHGGDHDLRVAAAASTDGRPSRPSATIRSLREPIAAWLRSLED